MGGLVIVMSSGVLVGEQLDLGVVDLSHVEGLVGDACEEGVREQLRSGGPLRGVDLQAEPDHLARLLPDLQLLREVLGRLVRALELDGHGGALRPVELLRCGRGTSGVPAR